MGTSPSVAFEQLRPDLGQTLMEFDLDANQQGMVGLAIAPPLEVSLAAGTYGKVVLKEMLKERDTRRNENGSYNRGGGKGTKDSYECEEHGFEEPVDRREAARFGNYWDAEQLAAQRARDVVLRNHNQRVITQALSVSATSAATAAFSVTATADPVKDVRTARINRRNATGVILNAVCMDWEAVEFLRDCDSILDRIKYDGHHNVDRSHVTNQMIADALGVEHLFVSGSQKNTANENKAASLASEWDRTKMLVFHYYAGKDLKKPQFMRTFHWGADGSKIGGVFESYYEPQVRGDVIRNRMDTDEKLIYDALGYVITGVLT